MLSTWKLRKSLRIVSFLTLSSSKIEDVLQNCYRLAALLMLSSSRIEEVSQNSFVFKLGDRQIDRSIDRSKDRQLQLQLQLQLHYAAIQITVRYIATTNYSTLHWLQYSTLPTLRVQLPIFIQFYTCCPNFSGGFCAFSVFHTFLPNIGIHFWPHPFFFLFFIWIQTYFLYLFA